MRNRRRRSWNGIAKIPSFDRGHREAAQAKKYLQAVREKAGAKRREKLALR